LLTQRLSGQRTRRDLDAQHRRGPDAFALPLIPEFPPLEFGLVHPWRAELAAGTVHRGPHVSGDADRPPAMKMTPMKKLGFFLLLVVSAACVAPRANAAEPITCDFAPLWDAIAELDLSDIRGPSDKARQRRVNSLLKLVVKAQHAATQGDLTEVLDWMDRVGKRTVLRKKGWIIPPATHSIADAFLEVMDCLATKPIDPIEPPPSDVGNPNPDPQPPPGSTPNPPSPIRKSNQ
jgi:hypothetical protein